MEGRREKAKMRRKFFLQNGAGTTVSMFSEIINNIKNFGGEAIFRCYLLVHKLLLRRNDGEK